MKKFFSLGICFLVFLGLCLSARAVEECIPEPTYTPDMPEYHEMEGGQHYTSGEFEQAIASYQRALELDPSYWHGYYGLAFTYRAVGRLDLAIENYTKVMEMAPEYAQPYASRAEIYRFLGRGPEAEADLNRYIAMYGQYPIPYIARGDYLLDIEEYQRAADDYTIAFEKGLALSASGEVYLKRALAWLRLDETERATADFEAAGQAFAGADAPSAPPEAPSYDEVESAPGAVPYAFNGFEQYVVIIGAYALDAEDRDPKAAGDQLETIRRRQDAFFALSDFYQGYAPPSVENGNELVSIVNQVLPMLDAYEVSYFDSGDVHPYELWEVIADAWYHFDPEGAASEDMQPTVEMVEFVLYQ